MSQNNYKLKIVESLLKSENHIRGLAKSLGTNQTTIARKVKALEQENVVDFKEEGRNKVVFLRKTLEAKHFGYMVETEKLIETIAQYPFLRRIIEAIQKNKKIMLAVLFGSFTTGSAYEKSDIDIYIDTKETALKQEIASLDSRISVKIGSYDQDSLLIKEIEKKHVVIKGVELFYEKNKFFD